MDKGKAKETTAVREIWKLDLNYQYSLPTFALKFFILWNDSVTSYSVSKASNFSVSPGKRRLVYDIAQHHKILDFQIFLYFLLYFKRLLQKFEYITKVRNKWNSKLPKSWKVKCAQGPKELRLPSWSLPRATNWRTRYLHWNYK